MSKVCGSQNYKGFENSIVNKNIPSQDHITFSGVFNSTLFSVGKKSEKLLELYHGYSITNSEFENSLEE